MNIVLRVLAAIALGVVLLPLAAVNQMDLLTRIDGEFDGSKMGHTVVSLDYNGDGHQDLVASAIMWNPTGVYDQYNGWGKLYFYLGGHGFNNIADYAFPGNWGGQYVGRLDNAGDVNGDGKDDFLMFTNRRDIPGETDHFFSLYIFYGRDVPTGQPDYVYNISEYDASQFGVTPLGDINNDGYDDLGMRKQVWARPYHNNVSVLLGSENGPNQIIPFRANQESWNLLFINGIGDVNADGIDDFHLLYHSSAEKRYTVFYGDSSFPDVDSLVIAEGYQGPADYDACALGDVNGDEIDDFSSFMTATGKIWLGSPNLNPVWNAEIGDNLVQYQATYPSLRHGDFNGDGCEDIVGSDYVYSSWTGRVGIWLGHQQFNGTVDLIINPPQFPSMQFGWSKAAGDFNADGYCDLAISSPFFYGFEGNYPGYIYIFQGNSQLIDTTVDNEDELAPLAGCRLVLNTYPNPFRGGTLHIEMDKADDISPNPDHIRLYNLKGQLIMQCETKASDWQQDTLALSLPDMPNGVYLLKLTDRKGHRISKKIVVTK